MEFYEVVVGGIGIVYSGFDKATADKTYTEYVIASDAPYGRASGESVCMFVDYELKRDHDKRPDNQALPCPRKYV